MAETVRSRLRQIETLVATGDRVAALTLALLAWRERRTTGLAQLVEALTPLPVAGATDEDLISWAVRGDGRALIGLRGVRKVRLGPAEARVRAFLGWPADPRLGGVVADLLADVPFTSDSSSGFWSALFQLVPNTGDPRLVPLAAKLDASWKLRKGLEDLLRSGLRAAVAPIAAQFPDGEPTLEADEVEVVGRVLSTLVRPQPTRTEDELWAEVYAAPDRDEPRQVLADFLVERGDVRGELIALQLGGDPSTAPREAQILARHGRAFLGALEPVIAKKPAPVFRRGCVAEVSVGYKHLPDAARFGLLPDWATVEKVTFGKHPLLTSRMLHLKAARYSDGSTSFLESLVADGPPWSLERVAVHYTLAARPLFDRLIVTDRLPSLRALEVSGPPELLRKLAKARFASQLETLRPWCAPSSMVPVFDAPLLFPSLKTLEVPPLLLRKDQDGAWTQAELPAVTPGFSLFDPSSADLIGWFLGELRPRTLSVAALHGVDPARMVELARQACVAELDLTAVGGAREKLGSWSAPSRPAPATPFHDCQALAFTDDGTLYVGVAEGVRRVDTSTWTPTGLVPGELGRSVAAHGDRLAFGNNDVVEVVDRASFGEVAHMPMPGAVMDLAFSPDGKWLAAGNPSGRVGLWAVATGLPSKILSPHTTWINQVAFSPDSRLLATGSQDGSVCLIDVVKRRIIKRLRFNDAHSVAFSHDGERLLIGGPDGLCLVRVADGALLVRHESTQSWTARFTPDGRVVASRRDGELALHDGASLVRRWSRPISTHGISRVAITPDGRTIVTAHEQESCLQLFDVETGELRQRVA